MEALRKSMESFRKSMESFGKSMESFRKSMPCHKTIYLFTGEAKSMPCRPKQPHLLSNWTMRIAASACQLHALARLTTLPHWISNKQKLNIFLTGGHPPLQNTPVKKSGIQLEGVSGPLPWSACDVASLRRA